MKTILYILILTLFFSCGNEKILLLPEISHSDITEIQDVSAGYLFYNETEKDSVELNRKNLISTTNWLINVDKRLTLKQVIPHIKFLQEKKENSSHKNKDAKNYFTCNDTSKNNLGFIEFTDVEYTVDNTKKPLKSDLKSFHEKKIKLVNSFHRNGPNITQEIILYFEKNNKIYSISTSLRKNDLKKYLSSILKIGVVNKLEVKINFHKNITFQEYISYKSLLIFLENESIQILDNEFIY